MVHEALSRQSNSLAINPKATAAPFPKLCDKANVACDLANKLVPVVGSKNGSADVQAYNALVIGWREILRLAESIPASGFGPAQGELLQLQEGINHAN